MSARPPLDLVVLTRKKIGHYWHVTGVVNGVKRSYRMPHDYMPDDAKGAEQAMKDGLELIDGHDARR
jgi:hypothetical protein